LELQKQNERSYLLRFSHARYFISLLQS